MSFNLRNQVKSHSLFIFGAILLLTLMGGLAVNRIGKSLTANFAKLNHSSELRTSSKLGGGGQPSPPHWSDRLGDGFPDGARLDTAPDRESFVRWVTFLAESQYYQPAISAKGEINDCAALVRFAFRNALVAHTAAWRRSVRLPFDPGFDDVAKFAYPKWPLGQRLFRVRSASLNSSDDGRDAFAEFADAETLLRYNSFFISHDIRAARPGDLLFFHQPGERQPYHSMLFVGRSNFRTDGSAWIVYHTGDLDGRPGEVREVAADLLLRHPDPRWRPLAGNPRFLGVYRFEILR